MERGSDAGGVLVNTGTGPVVVQPEHLRRWRYTVVGVAAAFVVLAGLIAYTLPRSLAYQALLQENLELKDHIQEIDRKMDDVDRVLLRLRLYDAQLRSLSEPKGDHGPVPEAAYANSGVQHAREALDTLDGAPMDELETSDWLASGNLRPADAWATAVVARADTMLATFEDAEPDLNAMVSDLEDLRAFEEAMPTSWPTQGFLSSGFGFRRSPFGWRTRDFHSGLDVANERGTPIYAAAAGVVLRADWVGSYGRMLELDHGFGITTRYGHLTTWKVRVGDKIERGDLIATMGASGRATGPHLHFEVRIDGNPVDPLDYLPR